MHAAGVEEEDRQMVWALNCGSNWLESEVKVRFGLRWRLDHGGKEVGIVQRPGWLTVGLRWTC